MLASALCPAANSRERFAYPDLRGLPTDPGCYALVTVDDVIIYIGQSINIAQRVAQHFDDPAKRLNTPNGVAFWCYYRRAKKSDLDRLERGWLNAHQIADGKLPHFNVQSGPV
ncbi:MAG: GIY-YIG nuclease family protein [Gammaproteobacteria bacterium]|nr:GIY-YIG nuclease family protein [Gammaproteobacteria bacterium]